MSQLVEKKPVFIIGLASFTLSNVNKQNIKFKTRVRSGKTGPKPKRFEVVSLIVYFSIVEALKEHHEILIDLSIFRHKNIGFSMPIFISKYIDDFSKYYFTLHGMHMFIRQHKRHQTLAIIMLHVRINPIWVTALYPKVT